MIERFLALAALCLLIGLPAISLDGRSLTAREGHHAMALIGPLELETRLPGSERTGPQERTEALGAPKGGLAHESPLLRFLRTGAAILGTSERVLRGICQLGVLLGTLLLVAICATTGRAAVGFIAPLYLSPLVLRGDGLEPEMWAFLPPALLLAGMALLRSRFPWSMLLYAIAGGSAAWLQGRAEWTCIILLLTTPFLLGRATLGRATLASSVAALPLVLVRLLELAPTSWASSASAPALGVRDLAPTASIVLLVLFGATTLACILMAVRGSHSNDQNEGRLLVLFGVLLVANAFPHFQGFSVSGTDWVAVLPLLSLIFATTLSGLPRNPGVVFSLGFLLLCGLSGWQVMKEKAPAPLWLVLEEASEWAEPGGRLLLHGDDRYALLYYSRHGHYPNIPTILSPDEGALPDLLKELPDRIRSGSSKPPSILAYPPLEAPGPFVREEQTALGLERLRLHESGR